MTVRWLVEYTVQLVLPPSKVPLRGTAAADFWTTGKNTLWTTAGASASPDGAADAPASSAWPSNTLPARAERANVSANSGRIAFRVVNICDLLAMKIE